MSKKQSSQVLVFGNRGFSHHQSNSLLLGLLPLDSIIRLELTSIQVHDFQVTRGYLDFFFFFCFFCLPPIIEVGTQSLYFHYNLSKNHAIDDVDVTALRE